MTRVRRESYHFRRLARGMGPEKRENRELCRKIENKNKMRKRWGQRRPADDAMYYKTRVCVRLLGGDAECPLQVCQLSRSSESTHFLSLRSRSFIRFHQSPGWLLRSEARASDLSPDYPEYKTPTLSYEAHPKYLKYG